MPTAWQVFDKDSAPNVQLRQHVGLRVLRSWPAARRWSTITGCRRSTTLRRWTGRRPRGRSTAPTTARRGRPSTLAPAETGWSSGETRFYEFPNETAFAIHRFRWKGTGGEEFPRFAELGFNRAAVSQTPFNLYASSGAGINGGAGFLASDVGRAIRLQGSDGEWRWAEVVSYVSPGQVTIVLHGHALPDLSPIGRWQLGTFVAGQYPEAVLVYEERLALARQILRLFEQDRRSRQFLAGRGRRRRHVRSPTPAAARPTTSSGSPTATAIC